MPIWREARTFENLKIAGISLVALTPRPHARDVFDFARRVPRRFALVVGGEGAGVSPDIEDMADALVRIPMRGGIDSLNLSTAAGIALYLLTRCGAP